MKAKKTIIALILIIAALWALLRIALWDASGGLIDFIRGQLDPPVRISRTDVSLKGAGGEPLRVSVSLDLSAPVNRVEDGYLSFAIDTSQLVGGKWWNPRADRVELGGGEKKSPLFNFDRPLMDLLAKALSPAYLRLGGTEADKVYYRMEGNDPAVPTGYESVLTRDRWDRLNIFARRNGLRLVFTLNAGPSARGKDGVWDGTNAGSLLAYSARKGYAVSVWELGNELNLFWYAYGPGRRVSVEQYRRDLSLARSLVKRHFPAAGFTGHSSAYWPVLGEPLSFFFGMMKDYVTECGPLVDHISWHYYPQQSRRGPIHSRRAHPARLLDPAYLDEAAYFADSIVALRNARVPGKSLWLGESGNAQFGGEPGVSDVYISGLWWMDQLGLLARHGHAVVVRQTLAGSDYGLIDDATLAPNPDYWNSLLWKRLMGVKVYGTKVEGDGDGKVRAYAHGPGKGNGITVLVINLHHDRDAVVSLPGRENTPYLLYALNTPDVLKKTVLLNGKKLEVVGGRALPSLEGVFIKPAGAPVITLHPLSYAFAVFQK